MSIAAIGHRITTQLLFFTEQLQTHREFEEGNLPPNFIERATASGRGRARSLTCPAIAGRKCSDETGGALASRETPSLTGPKRTPTQQKCRRFPRQELGGAGSPPCRDPQ